MIVENEIPILEYDDSSPEIIPPDHDWTAGRLPEKCLFAFLGDIVHKYAKEQNAEVVEIFQTVSYNIEIYVLHEDLDTLISCGCKKIIAVGSCGVLADLEENAFIVPTKALRAEGTSYHYLPASRYIELDEEPIAVMEETFRKHNLPFVTCITWSTDGFFRETKDMVRYRLEEGCSVVEMECAALAACSRKRGAKFGQFLFTADTLANVHEYDARDFGMGSHEKALLLGLDILRNYSLNGSICKD